MKPSPQQITADEALPALRAAARLVTAAPVFEPAVDDFGPLYLHTCGAVGNCVGDDVPRSLCGHDPECGQDDNGWQPLYVNVTPPPQRMVGCLFGHGGDLPLDVVEAKVREAAWVGWEDGPLGRHLAVRGADGRKWAFEVRPGLVGAGSPGAVPGPAAAGRARNPIGPRHGAGAEDAP